MSVKELPKVSSVQIKLTVCLQAKQGVCRQIANNKRILTDPSVLVCPHTSQNVSLWWCNYYSLITMPRGETWRNLVDLCRHHIFIIDYSLRGPRPILNTDCLSGT